MIKNISKDFTICLLVFISVYLWDIRLLSENKQISENSNLFFINYIEFRWVYLLSIFLIYKSYFNYKKKINKISFIISILLIVHYLFNTIYLNDTNIDQLNIIKIISIFLVLILTILIIDYNLKYFLNNYIIFLKYMVLISAAIFIFSLLYNNLIYEDENLIFKPCYQGIYNRVNFFYSESSHFGMVAISIFLSLFYQLQKKNFNDYKLFVIFLIFTLIILYNFSLTILAGIIFCHSLFLFFCFKQYGIKNLLTGILMLFLFAFVLFANPVCKIKLGNAAFHVTSKLEYFGIDTTLAKKLIKRNPTNSAPLGEDKGDVNVVEIEINGIKYNLKKRMSDLSSAVLIHNLKVAYQSIQDRPLGWGINNYKKAFDFYSKNKIKVLNHHYVLFLNQEDGSINMIKLIVEFGIMGILLLVAFFLFLISSKISLEYKILLLPSIITQTLFRGSGFFNGGYYIITTIILMILIKTYINNEKQY